MRRRRRWEAMEEALRCGCRPICDDATGRWRSSSGSQDWWEHGPSLQAAERGGRVDASDQQYRAVESVDGGSGPGREAAHVRRGGGELLSVHPPLLSLTPLLTGAVAIGQFSSTWSLSTIHQPPGHRPPCSSVRIAALSTLRAGRWEGGGQILGGRAWAAALCQRSCDRTRRQ